LRQKATQVHVFDLKPEFIFRSHDTSHTLTESMVAASPFAAYYSHMADRQPKEKHAADIRWVIEGFDGSKSVFRTTLPKGDSWPDPRIIELLRRLVSRRLSEDDVINASRVPRDQFYNPVLKDRRSSKGRLTITVGENPFYVATLWQADEQDH
jgi:hypothetical protein